MWYYDARIIRLLQLYFTGVITEKEKQELDLWCEQREENFRFFQELQKDSRFSKEFPRYRFINEKKAFRLFEAYVKKKAGPARIKKKRFLIRRRWKYVAVLMLPILVSALWLWNNRKDVRHPMPVVKVNVIPPGSFKAVLTLDNGRHLLLEDKEQRKIPVHDRIRITQDTNQLVYTALADKDTLSNKFNKLETPRGGEYKITLADGTFIYLNSATRLKYPIAFNGRERKVYLSGEAYFEVSKDPKRPFRVVTDEMEIQVYGTAFNLNTLRTDVLQTTLVEGSIGIRVIGRDTVYPLHPGQLATLTRKGRQLQIHDVDTRLYTDWKEGIFRFEDERLEDILNTLSNWYNVNVFYQSEEAKEFHFSGYMKRYNTINIILETITEVTGIHFSVQEKTIIVSK